MHLEMSVSKILAHGTSKLPKFYRNDFKHDLYCCIWLWFEMSAENPFEHTVPSPPACDRPGLKY